MSSIETFIEQLPEISTAARYWFVRTEGGSLYEHFVSSFTIGIGYPKIKVKDIAKLPVERLNEELRKLVLLHYPEKLSPGIAVSQLQTFFTGIKEGDFILIPSYGTAKISIGIVSGKPFRFRIDRDNLAYKEFNKRIPVKWVGAYRRESFNPRIWRILQAHQTIVEATQYAPWIDSLVYDFFKKGEEYHYSIRIGKREHINGKTLFETCLELFEVGDQFAKDNEFEEDSNNIDVKINLNSPGEVELIASTAKVLGTIALTIIMLNGGGLKFTVQKFGIDLNISTDGFMKSLSKFLNDKANRRIKDSLNQQLQNLEVKDSAQIESMITKLNESDS